MICGGTMAGNCASGNPRMETSPRMTVRIEITIATMGRLTKNLEIMNQSFYNSATDVGFTAETQRTQRLRRENQAGSLRPAVCKAHHRLSCVLCVSAVNYLAFPTPKVCARL